MCCQKVLNQLMRGREASLLLTQFCSFNMCPELANMAVKSQELHVKSYAP